MGAFKDLTGFTWTSKEGHDYFANTFCGFLAQSPAQQEICLKHLECVIDEIYWSSTPGMVQGSTVDIQPNATCNPVVESARTGFYHPYEKCQCSTSGCTFCGTDGVCCPRFAMHKDEWCKGKGCLWGKCCWPKNNGSSLSSQ